MRKTKAEALAAYEAVKAEVDSLEMFNNITGTDFSDYRQLIQKISDEKQVDLLFSMIRPGYHKNQKLITYFEAFFTGDHFKDLVIQKLITVKFDRDTIIFAGDLQLAGYLTLEQVKHIISELEIKNAQSALSLLCYCRESFRQKETEYFNKKGEELLRITKSGNFDYLWIEEVFGELVFSELTEDQFAHISLMLGEKIYVDIFYDNAEDLSTYNISFDAVPKVHSSDFPFNPILWSIYCGSVQCFKMMIMSMKEEEINWSGAKKFGYRLAVRSGNDEMIRSVQNFIQKRNFNIGELNYAINSNRINIARWIADNNDILSKFASNREFVWEDLTKELTEYQLYFYSQYIDLTPSLENDSPKEFVKLSIIINTAESLAGILKLLHAVMPCKSFILLLCYDLVDIPAAYNKYKAHHFTIFRVLTENFPDICKITVAFLKDALLYGNINAAEYIISKGISLDELPPEERISAAFASRAMKMIYWILDRTPSDGLYLPRLYTYGPCPDYIYKIQQEREKALEKAQSKENDDKEKQNDDEQKEAKDNNENDTSK